ncbi:MAG: glycosyltransferase [Candidatus Moranbacteria bacterium]|nr:glycosyltransferase [Candidatus Moranbacteria bacterium]
MKYSFIIPVKTINAYIRESVPKILEIKRDDFEILIYPDEATAETWLKTRQIASGHCGPAEKRKLALKDAAGDFLIFIDDDAYPEKNILEVLDNDFENEFIAAVGGPAATPQSDSFLQKVSGAFFLSSLSGGFPERYIPIGKKRFVKDWPSVNLTVRKSIFGKVGGFDSHYWPGEDTKFCLDVIEKINKNNKILYDPGVIVWHHRREGLIKHLKQAGSYGLHRGFFAKKYPKTSMKIKYFIPSAFFIFALLSFVLFVPFVLSVLSVQFVQFVLRLFLLGWLIYLLALIKAFFEIYRHEKSFSISLYAILYTFLTHLFYGARFIQGFIFTRNLKSRLR